MKITISLPDELHEALLKKSGRPGGYEHHDRVESYPPEIVGEAAVAQQVQLLGYHILRDSAAAEGAGGVGMADAATSLGSGFDFRASRCISSGEFTLSLSQVELDLGYIPLLQIGLIFWKRGHRFSGAPGLGLAAVASTISFRLSGRFEPRPGRR
jgi:hypothetical protein